MSNSKPYKNRREAGRVLANRLKGRTFVNPVILALPRGGVPVALEVARALRAPLDLVLVRKIGIPNHPELAAAAVVNGGHPEIVVNDDIAAHAGLTRADIGALASVELEEIERRRDFYLANRERVPLKGHSVIVVDDGIATGATVRAALHALQRKKPLRLLLAVPVAPHETIESLRGEVDEIICLDQPDPFVAVGLYYEDFRQVSDHEVVALLSEDTSLAATGARQVGQ